MAKVPFFNFVKGANTGVSPFLQPVGSLTIANGVNTSHKLGAILKDTGYYRSGLQMESGKNITGLFDFQQTSTIQRIFATMNDSTDDDTQLFAKTPSGAWGEIAAAETSWANKANINVEMEGFINYLFIVGYGTTDGFITPGSVTGTTFSTAPNVTSMPNAKYIKRFKDRLYIANTDISGTATPFRVYYSSVPSGSPAAITWTVATDFFDVDYSLDITGLGANLDRLFIFTRDATYFYDGAQLKKVWEYGCSNNRTVKNYGSYVIWCTGDNIAVSTGGQPQLIGGPIIDFIRAGNAQNFFSAMIDDEYHIYVGDVTVKGIAYTNCFLTYNFTTNAWRWRETYDTMNIFASYFDNTTWTRNLLMGDTSGQVWIKSKYTDTTVASSDSETTLGTEVNAISSHFQFILPFGSMSTSRELDNLVAYADRAGGVKLKGRVLDRNTRVLTPWFSLGELTKFSNVFNVDIEEGALLEIEGVETGTSPYWSFYGMEIEVQDAGNVLSKPHG